MDSTQGGRTELPLDTKVIESRNATEMAREFERFRISIEDEFDRVRSLASQDDAIRRTWMGL